MAEKEAKRDDLYGVTFDGKPIDQYIEETEKEESLKQSIELLEQESQKGLFYRHQKEHYKPKKERNGKMRSISPEAYRNENPDKHAFDLCNSMKDFVVAILMTGKELSSQNIRDYLHESNHEQVLKLKKKLNIKAIQNILNRIGKSQFSNHMTVEKRKSGKRKSSNYYSIHEETKSMRFQEAQRLSSRIKITETLSKGTVPGTEKEEVKKKTRNTAGKQPEDKIENVDNISRDQIIGKLQPDLLPEEGEAELLPHVNAGVASTLLINLQKIEEQVQRITEHLAIKSELTSQTNITIKKLVINYERDD